MPKTRRAGLVWLFFQLARGEESREAWNDQETGWRGYALPRLQFGRSALVATIILWFFWALWHLPTFFYLYDPAILVGWIIGLFAGAIVITWLFNSSSGSILIVALWHRFCNFITSIDAGDGILAAVVTTTVMFSAIIVS